MDVHCICFLRNFRTENLTENLLIKAFKFEPQKVQQSKEITTKNQKVVSFISCVINFIFSPRHQLKYANRYHFVSLNTIFSFLGQHLFHSNISRWKLLL